MANNKELVKGDIGMADGKFKVYAPYEPMGDQPKAIASLAEGIERGEWAQVLMGATGTGKNLYYGKIDRGCAKTNIGNCA